MSARESSRCPLCESDDPDVRAAHAAKFTQPGTWREHRKWASYMTAYSPRSATAKPQVRGGVQHAQRP